MTGCNGCKFKQLNGKERGKNNKICCQRKGARYFHKEIILDEDHPDYNQDFECALKGPYESNWIETARRYDAMGHCILCYHHVWVESKDGNIIDICEIDGLPIEKILMMSNPDCKKGNHMDDKCPVQKMKMMKKKGR